MATRILLFTQWFDPEPTFKGIVFARALVEQGFEVEVLTGFPNYPNGRIYPGYWMKWLQCEWIDGVQVTRVPLYPSHDQSAVKRVLNYASFAASSFIYGVFRAKKPDVIYAYHPPLTVGVTASLLRFFRRVPVIYDIQDMWPDTLRATGMVNNEKVLKSVDMVCRWVYRRVDQIVVLSPGFSRLLQDRGVPSSKIEVIYNWADESSLAAPKGRIEDIFPGSDRFKILFAGNMGNAQSLDTVLNAASTLQEKKSRVTFVMLGGGVDVKRLKRKTAELQLQNVQFLPPVPMSEVGSFIQASDALLVHLRNDPLFEITIPSKIQAYMAAAKPIIIGVKGDAADLIQWSKCGELVEPENAESLASVAESMASMPSEQLALMGERASEYYQDHLSLAVGSKKFGQIIRALVSGDSV
ncbi:MAG: glycosyltransferase family 4 protein [Candidatus Sedimenticola sp. (ex Thyasira tokunagai)]